MQRASDGIALGTLMSEVPRDKWGHPVLPMPEKISRKDYERALLALQIELVKMQQWARADGERVLLLFEGRDTRRQGRHDPTHARAHEPALRAPCRASRAQRDARAGSGTSSGTSNSSRRSGEIAFFDRSWYNRAGVERVMGFATDDQVDRFFDQVVPFEQFLVDDGIHLVKIWLSVGRDEQVQRLERAADGPAEAVEAQPARRAGPGALGGLHARRRSTLFRRTDTTQRPGGS